jgi:hypothetical protein
MSKTYIKVLFLHLATVYPQAYFLKKQRRYVLNVDSNNNRHVFLRPGYNINR